MVGVRTIDYGVDVVKSMKTDYTGHTLEGRYAIQQKLAEGGMGAVYLGVHITVGRRVAVKFLHEDFAENEEIIARFFREAQAAAAVAHRNIIDVWDVGISPDGGPFLVMEYLEGESLAHMLMRTGPITLPAACAILEPVLSGLGAAHGKGIIHRDLKPENIFLAQVEGEFHPVIKLIDFGISKFTHQSDASKLTRTGAMLGTPAFMPPEQLRGDRELDQRADLYAVGVILYKMLTGGMPFEGENYNALVVNVLTEDPIPPRQTRPDFPAEAEPLLTRLLSKDPAGRPKSAKELIADLEMLSGKDQRVTHLSRYTTGITDRQCAAGDLGDAVSNKGKGAAEVLAEMSLKPTPSAWSGTGSAARRRGGTAVIALIAAALSVGATLLWQRADRTSEPPLEPIASKPTTAQPPPPRTPDRVSIQILGTPENAVIRFNGKRMVENPFTVAASALEASLEIIAPGYVDYKGTVVPSENRVIEAGLVPLPEVTIPTQKPELLESEPVKPPPAKPKRSTQDGKHEAAKDKGRQRGLVEVEGREDVLYTPTFEK